MASAGHGPAHPRIAFATFLMLNDNYLPGALTLAYGLRRQGPRAPLIALATDGVSDDAREALDQLYDHVVEVDRIYVPHARRQERQDRPYYFTRIQVLRLGPDGDLGFDLERVVVIDADVLPLREYARLLEIEAPAGVLNERKSHFVQVDDEGQYVLSEEMLRSGQWNWHAIYAECLHGEPVPRYISDRPRDDPQNMGFNGSLFIMHPSATEYRAILEDIRRPEMRKLVGDKFDWPDMQYLTLRWSGTWRNIDARFSALNGYPDLSVLYGTHFAGFKPWYFHRRATMERYARYADFQLWFETYEEMLETHPQLQRMAKLRRLLDDVRGARQSHGFQRGASRQDQNPGLRA